MPKIPRRQFLKYDSDAVIISTDGVYHKGEKVKCYSKSEFWKMVFDYFKKEHNANKTRKQKTLPKKLV